MNLIVCSVQIDDYVLEYNSIKSKSYILLIMNYRYPCSTSILIFKIIHKYLIYVLSYFYLYRGRGKFKFLYVILSLFYNLCLVLCWPCAQHNANNGRIIMLHPSLPSKTADGEQQSPRLTPYQIISY